MAVPFHYEYHNTVFHNLNPLAKLLLFSWFMFFGGLYLDPRITVPMLVALLAILHVARLPLARYRSILLVATVATMLGRGYHSILIADPAMYKAYPQGWASTLLVELTGPDFPILGRTAITYGSLLYLTALPVQLANVVLSVAGLLHTTSLGDIVSVLSRLRAPFPVTFMSSVSLRFVPLIVEHIESIKRAQSLRGWSMETRNPIKKVMLLRPLLVPLARRIVRAVDTLTMSAKNRAMGLGPVTPLVSFEFARRDRLICALVVVVSTLCIYATFVWNFGSL